MKPPLPPTTWTSTNNPPLAVNAPLRRLLAIMAALRTPKTGCPWDLQQTHASIAPYALEEAYEVVDAIERDDMDGLRDELGDLLLQVVFHARIAEEAGAFSFDDVAEGICRKMERRHPHVFDTLPPKPAVSGVDKIWEAMRAKREENAAKNANTNAKGLLGAFLASENGTKPGPGEARTNPAPAERPKSIAVRDVDAGWERIKAEERRAKNEGREPGVLDDVPLTLPGLTRAVKLQKKASLVGFDWGDARLVLAKIREEIDEIDEALDGGKAEAVTDEIGDLMFAVANLARHAKVDPETAMRGTNAKFERRFAFIERELAARGTTPDASTLQEMDALWDAAKRAGL